MPFYWVLVEQTELADGRIHEYCHQVKAGSPREAYEVVHGPVDDSSWSQWGHEEVEEVPENQVLNREYYDVVDWRDILGALGTAAHVVELARGDGVDVEDTVALARWMREQAIEMFGPAAGEQDDYEEAARDLQRDYEQA